MKRCCAWCEAEIGPVEGTETDERISHGICEGCLGKPEFQWRIALSRFLEILPHPVLLVDEDAIGITNSLACKTLGTTAPAVGNDPDDDVFECAQNCLPGGCGRKVCCSGCAIRQAIAWTHETGDSLFSVPAVLDRSCPDDPASATLRITTMKMMEVVILRVDRVAELLDPSSSLDLPALALPWTDPVGA